jgi:uncharacterized protein (DUF2384 family)
MKSSKKYQSSKKTSKVEEPLMAPCIPFLTKLNQMSFDELERAHIPGEKLNEIQEETSLEAQDVAGILGVSMSKYYKLLRLDDIGYKSIDALADFATLWQKGIDAFDDNSALLNEWLETRNVNLGHFKPIELLSSRVGRRALEKAFLRIEYSTYG